jgi:hypothetical protein
MTTNEHSTNGHMRLTDADLERLRARYIPEDIAERAGIYRVSSQQGAELVGRRSSATTDYAGIVIPNFWPGERTPREYRLRRDHPTLERQPDGTIKEVAKYLSPPGRGNLLYFPPDTFPERLDDRSIPAVITEGELKSLALWRMSAELELNWLIIGLSGVWNWKGVVEKITDDQGRRRDVHGPIPDLTRIEWADRLLYVVFDANVATNAKVLQARTALARNRAESGAQVYFVEIPLIDGVNGVDDLLHIKGVAFVHDLFQKAIPAPEWIKQASQRRPLSDEDRRAIRKMFQVRPEPDEETESNQPQEISHVTDAVSFVLVAAEVPERFRGFIDAVIGASNGDVQWFNAPDAFIGMRARGTALHRDSDGALLVEEIKKENLEKWVQRARKDFTEWQKAVGFTIIETAPGGKREGVSEPTRYRLPVLALASTALENARRDPDFETKPHRALRRAASAVVKSERYNLINAPRRERFRRPKKTAQSYRKMCLTYAGKFYKTHFVRNPDRAEQELGALVQAMLAKEFDPTEEN